MTGGFEVFVDEQMRFRFRLLDADGAVLAVSATFEDKREAAAGIAALRESAGMGLVTDLTGSAPGTRCPHENQTGFRVPMTPSRAGVLDILAS